MSSSVVHFPHHRQVRTQRTLWLLALLLGGVFFSLGHNLQISTVEGWTPWADSTETFYSKNLALRGAIFGLVAFAGLVCLYRSDTGVPRITGLALLVIGYVGWCFLSLAWSHDPGTTLIRMGVMGLTCLGAYGFSRVLSPSQWISLGMLVTGAFLVIGVLTEVSLGTFRPFSPGYRFAGTAHPNAQGAFMVILTLGAYCLTRWGPSNQRRWLLLLPIGLCFLVLTKSRTACASVIAVIVLLECVIIPTRKSLFIGLCLVWVVCGVVFLVSASGVDLVDEAVQAAHLGRSAEAEALNGRLPLWEAVMPFARDEWMLGYGLDSFWTGDHIEHIQHIVHWPARDAHSLYLNTVLGIGVIGLMLLLLMIFAALWRSAQAFRRNRDPGYAFLIALLVTILSFGVLETMPSPMSLYGVLICCGIAHLAFETRECRTLVRQPFESMWTVDGIPTEHVLALERGATR